jgi:hypothetical protein
MSHRMDHHITIALLHADKAMRRGDLDMFERWLKAADRYIAIEERLRRLAAPPKEPKLGMINPR